MLLPDSVHRTVSAALSTPSATAHMVTAAAAAPFSVSLPVGRNTRIAPPARAARRGYMHGGAPPSRSVRCSYLASIAFTCLFAALLSAISPFTVSAAGTGPQPLSVTDRGDRLLVASAAAGDPDAVAVPPFLGDHAHVRGPAPPEVQALFQQSLLLEDEADADAGLDGVGSNRRLMHGKLKPRAYPKCGACRYVTCNANRAYCSGHCKALRTLFFCDNKVVGPPVGVPQPLNAPDEPGELNYGSIKPLQVTAEGPYVGCAVVDGGDPCRVANGTYAALNGSLPLMEDVAPAIGDPLMVDATCFSGGASVVPRFLGVELGTFDYNTDDQGIVVPVEDDDENDYAVEVGVCVCKYEAAGSGAVVEDLCISAESAGDEAGSDDGSGNADDASSGRSRGTRNVVILINGVRVSPPPPPRSSSDDPEDGSDGGLFPPQEVQFGSRTINISISADAEQDGLVADGLVGAAEDCISEDYDEGDYDEGDYDESVGAGPGAAPGGADPCAAANGSSTGRRLLSRSRSTGARRTLHPGGM